MRTETESDDVLRDNNLTIRGWECDREDLLDLCLRVIQARENLFICPGNSCGGIGEVWILEGKIQPLQDLLNAFPQFIGIHAAGAICRNVSVSFTMT